MKKKAEAASRFLAVVAAWLYILAMVAVMPFYFEQGYTYIGTNKSIFFHTYGFPLVLTALLTSAVYGVFVIERTYRGKNGAAIWQLWKTDISATDIFMILYLIALLASYSFSRYPETAGMGNTSWYMGLLPHLALITSYFVISRVFCGVRFLFGLIMLVTSVVFGLGILNRYGIYPIEMENAGPHFISTIGNINWYCGYWSVLVWIGLICFWNDRKREGKPPALSWLLGVVTMIGIGTGITQGSDSGILALGIGLLTLFAISIKEGHRMERFTLVMFLFSFVCASLFLVERVSPGAATFYSYPMRLLTQTILPWFLLLIFGFAYCYIRYRNKKESYPSVYMDRLQKVVLIGIAGLFALYLVILLLNTLLPEGLGPFRGVGLFTFDSKWGSFRGGTWTIGLEIWNSQNYLHRLFGVGPDCMGAYIYSSGNERVLALVREQFGASVLLNAHGEWVTCLANLGLLGTSVFAGVIISALGRFFKGARENPVMYVFAFCILGYTANNLFSFQTTLNTTQMFLLLAVGESVIRRTRHETYMRKQ